MAFLIAFAFAGIANVVGEALGWSTLALVTKPLLMPLLACWLIAMRRRTWAPWLTWLLIGIGFAWIGDLLLMVDAEWAFMAGLGAFLVMNAMYITAFRAIPGPGLVRAWPLAAIPYVIAWIGINAMLAPGALRIPVIVYSAVLIAMGVLALDLVLRLAGRERWWPAIGAALFIVSDALIALTRFGPLQPSHASGALVMLTYLAAQAFIVVGLARGQALAASRSR